MSVEAANAYGQAMRDGHAAAWATRWREAVGHYQRAADAIPEDMTARSSLASALVHAGQPHEALGLFEELAVERPDDTAVLLRVAELRHRVGRVDDADRAYLAVAAAYVQASQGEKAGGIWRRLISSSGHRGATMTAVADAALAAGNSDLGEEARRAAAAAGAVSPAVISAGPAEAAPAGDWVAALAALLRAPDTIARWGSPSPRLEPGPAAVDDALAAIAATPADTAASRRLGTALLAAGAVEAGRRQLADVANLAEIDGELGLAADVCGELLLTASEALPLYRRIARLALLGEAVEVAASAHLALADDMARRGDPGAALTEARRARAVAPVSANTQAEAADRLAMLGAIPEADEARQRAFQLAPREPRHVARYLASAARRDALEELLLADEMLRQLAPDRELAAHLVESELGAPASVTLLGRGLLLAWAGIAEADHILRRAADTAAPVGPVAAATFAARALAADRAEDAAVVLDRWVQGVGRMQDPECLGILAELALTAAERTGNAALALTSLSILVERSPEDGTLGSLYAERLASAGRPVEAARELARLADSARQRGDLDATAALLEGAAFLDPNHIEHALGAAELAQERGNRDAARRLYIQAAEADPTRAAAPLLAAAELSAPAARLELLRRAIAYQPRDPAPRQRLVQTLVASGQVGLAGSEALQLAELLLEQGDREGARTAIDEARRLDPWNPDAAKLRRALEQ